MVNLIHPTPDDCICDPACGTAGFLISAANYVREHNANKMNDKQWDHYMKGLVTCVDVKNLADGCTKSFENAIEKERFL